LKFEDTGEVLEVV